MAKSGANRTEKKEPLRAKLDCHGNRDARTSLGLWSSGTGPLQQKLARALMDVIRQGAIAPGIRLPSERCAGRALADQPHHGRRGLRRVAGARVAGQPRRQRHLGVRAVRRPSRAARSSAQESALAASPLLGLLDQRGDEDVVELALGTPLPLEELPAERFTLPRDEHAALLRDRGYYPFGLPALRQAIAAEFCRSGLPTDREQVLVTNGAQHAFMLCAMLYLQRGDTALARGSDLLRRAGRLPGHRRANRHGPGRRRRRRARGDSWTHDRGGRAPGLPDPTFQNPTGAVMPHCRRARNWREWSSEFGVTVVDDRTMADLILEGSPPPPLAAFAPDQPDSDDRFVEQAGVAGTSCRLDSRARTDGPAPGAVEERDGSRVTDHDAGRRGATGGHARRGARAATSAVEASTRPARVAAAASAFPTGRSGCRTAGCSCG